MSVRGKVEKYVKALTDNISDRFPSSTTAVLDAFSIFNLDEVPADVTSPFFYLYGEKELSVLKQHYLASDQQGASELEMQWGSFKYELVELKKKWSYFQDQVKANKMKVKCTPTEWALRQVLTKFQGDDEFCHITSIVKTAIVTPVSNAWPERGGSAIKRIKSRSRSSMKNDMLSALLIISINGPDVHSQDADKLVCKVAQRFSLSRRHKRPMSSHPIQDSGVSVAVQTSQGTGMQEAEIDDEVDNQYEIEGEMQLFEKQLQASHKVAEVWGEYFSSSDGESSDEEMAD